MSEHELREERIRHKAYELWEEAGHPEGDGVEFWLLAEEWDAADAIDDDAAD